MYTLCRSPPAFYECLMTVVITILCTTAAQKNFLYYLLTTYLLLKTLIQKNLGKVIWYYLDLLEWNLVNKAQKAAIEKWYIRYIPQTEAKNAFKNTSNFMAPFYGWGLTVSRLEPFRGGSLLFNTKFPEIPCTHFINLRRMKDWVDLGAT